MKKTLLILAALIIVAQGVALGYTILHQKLNTISNPETVDNTTQTAGKLTLTLQEYIYSLKSDIEVKSIVKDLSSECKDTEELLCFKSKASSLQFVYPREYGKLSSTTKITDISYPDSSEKFECYREEIASEFGDLNITLESGSITNGNCGGGFGAYSLNKLILENDAGLNLGYILTTIQSLNIDGTNPELNNMIDDIRFIAIGKVDNLKDGYIFGTLFITTDDFSAARTIVQSSNRALDEINYQNIDKRESID